MHAIELQYTRTTTGPDGHKLNKECKVWVDIKSVLVSLIRRWNNQGYNGMYTYSVTLAQTEHNLKVARPMLAPIGTLVHSSAITYNKAV